MLLFFSIMKIRIDIKLIYCHYLFLSLYNYIILINSIKIMFINLNYILISK